jgi:hypothetical protein
MKKPAYHQTGGFLMYFFQSVHTITSSPFRKYDDGDETESLISFYVLFEAKVV